MIKNNASLFRIWTIFLKHTVIIIILLSLGISALKATHLLGSGLDYRYLNGDHYQISLVIYNGYALYHGS